MRNAIRNRSRFSWNRDTFDTLLRWFLRCNATEPFAFEYLSVQCAPLAWCAVLDTYSHSLGQRRLSNGILKTHFSKRTLWNLLCTCIHGLQTISGDYRNTYYCGSYQKAAYPMPKVSQSSIYGDASYIICNHLQANIIVQNFHSFTASFTRCSNVSGSLIRSTQSSDSAAGAAGALCCFIRSLRAGRTAVLAFRVILHFSWMRAFCVVAPLFLLGANGQKHRFCTEKVTVGSVLDRVGSALLVGMSSRTLSQVLWGSYCRFFWLKSEKMSVEGGLGRYFFVFWVKLPLGKLTGYCT